MLCFVGNIRTEISSNHAMPSRVIFLIKFFFDECCDILFNVEFFKGLISTIHGIALHIFSHIRIFNNCFSVGHYLKFFFFLFEDFKFKKISFINFLFFSLFQYLKNNFFCFFFILEMYLLLTISIFFIKKIISQRNILLNIKKRVTSNKKK